MLTRAKVDFKLPDFKKLNREGFTTVDMHCHSRYSDGFSRVSSIVRKAKKLGFGIAITDHNEIKGCLEAAKDRKMMVIPGIEVTAAEGMHMLLYFHSTRDIQEFYNKCILPNKAKSFLNIGIKEIVDYSNDFNCVVSAAHPYALMWQGISKPVHKRYINDQIWSNIDAVEVICGSNIKKRNYRAVELAERLKKGITGGSDAHTLKEVGRVLTYTKYNSTVSSFLDSILANKTHVIGKETPLPRKIASQSIKIKAPGKHPIGYLKKGVHYLRNRRG
jgi:predicted metal-dependent phosphoesterase TrpH